MVLSHRVLMHLVAISSLTTALVDCFLNYSVECLSTASTTTLDFLDMWKISSTPTTDLWYQLVELMQQIRFMYIPSFTFSLWFLFLLQVTILTMFTLITLYSTIIPISLYVSIEVDTSFLL